MLAYSTGVLKDGRALTSDRVRVLIEDAVPMILLCVVLVLFVIDSSAHDIREGQTYWWEGITVDSY